MQEHKLMGMPAFIIGDKSFAGLDTQKLESLIDYKVEHCPNCNQALRLPKNKGPIIVTCAKCEQKFKIKT